MHRKKILLQLNNLCTLSVLLTRFVCLYTVTTFEHRGRLMATHSLAQKVMEDITVNASEPELVRFYPTSSEVLLQSNSVVLVMVKFNFRFPDYSNPHLSWFLCYNIITAPAKYSTFDHTSAEKKQHRETGQISSWLQCTLFICTVIKNVQTLCKMNKICIWNFFQSQFKYLLISQINYHKQLSWNIFELN